MEQVFHKVKSKNKLKLKLVLILKLLYYKINHKNSYVENVISNYLIELAIVINVVYAFLNMIIIVFGSEIV